MITSSCSNITWGRDLRPEPAGVVVQARGQRPRTGCRLLRGEQKKGRALAFNGKRGLGLDLLGRRPPLLQVRQAKALVQEEADVGGNGPMLFDDAFCQPVRRALALTQIAAHRPRLATADVIAPARL